MSEFPSEQTQYLISVEDGYSPDKVAADLAHIGLSVDRVLQKTGVVGGSGSSDLWKAIRSVPGVAQVRHEQGFQLPPFSESAPQ